MQSIVIILLAILVFFPGARDTLSRALSQPPQAVQAPAPLAPPAVIEEQPVKLVVPESDDELIRKAKHVQRVITYEDGKVVEDTVFEVPPDSEAVDKS